MACGFGQFSGFKSGESFHPGVGCVGERLYRYCTSSDLSWVAQFGWGGAVWSSVADAHLCVGEVL